MSPKDKVQIAREHLDKAQEEAVGGDLRDAVQWSEVSTATKTWTQPAPARGALSEAGLAEPEVWAGRLRQDRARATHGQASELVAITSIVEARSRDLGANALVLSGSTARWRRTAVSDLDYHVIGARPDVADLPEDIDLYSDAPDEFDSKLRSGDDFVHWSVWYGCVLFDDGVMLAAARYLASTGAWPDARRKLYQARDALPFAERLVASGDPDAAQEQMRGVLSLIARWLLLAHSIFPLSRDELSDQVRELGHVELATALGRAINSAPDLDELAAAAELCRRLTGVSAESAVQAALG